MIEKKTLYVTDLDGTLLNSESRISEESKYALNSLSSRGCPITFATARTPATVKCLFEGIKLNIPGVVMTGASLYDLDKGEYINPHFISEEQVSIILEIMENLNVTPFVYTLSDAKLTAYHKKQMSTDETVFYSMRRDCNLKKFVFSDDISKWRLDNALLIFAIGRLETFQHLSIEIEKAIGYSPTYYNDIMNPGKGYFEIFAPEVSKAAAIERLKMEYGFTRVVVFGDNRNDLSMFKIADLSIAPSNAYDDVKSMADLIIGDNDSNSVVKFIIRDFGE